MCCLTVGSDSKKYSKNEFVMLVNVQYIYRFFSNAIKGESTKSTDRIFLLMMVNCRDFNFLYIYVHIHIYIYILCMCCAILVIST